jgi:hypothetical protein
MTQRQKLPEHTSSLWLGLIPKLPKFAPSAFYTVGACAIAKIADKSDDPGVLMLAIVGVVVLGLMAIVHLAIALRSPKSTTSPEDRVGS